MNLQNIEDDVFDEILLKIISTNKTKEDIMYSRTSEVKFAI